FHGDIILSAWVGSESSSRSFLPLALLALGFWFSALLSNCYSVSLAVGQPGIPLRMSAFSAVPYAFGMYMLVRGFGIVGAGLAWLLLNFAYVLFLVPTVHKNVLKTSTLTWLWRTVFPFVALGCLSFGVPRVI